MNSQTGPDGLEFALKKAGVPDESGTVYTEEGLRFAASRSFRLRYDDEHKTLYGEDTLLGEYVPAEPLSLSFNHPPVEHFSSEHEKPYNPDGASL